MTNPEKPGIELPIQLTDEITPAVAKYDLSRTSLIDATPESYFLLHTLDFTISYDELFYARDTNTRAMPVVPGEFLDDRKRLIASKIGLFSNQEPGEYLIADLRRVQPGTMTPAEWEEPEEESMLVYAYASLDTKLNTVFHGPDELISPLRAMIQHYDQLTGGPDTRDDSRGYL